MSCIIGEKLGLKCPMFDINCACPGFVYALDMAETYYKAGKIRNAIVACVEEPTRMASWKDRGTCVLFGDGAGAVVLTEGDNIKGTKLHAEPSKDEIWQFRTLVDTPYITKKEEDVPMQMKGREVFKFAVKACTEGVQSLLDEVGIDERGGILHDSSGQPENNRLDHQLYGSACGEVPRQHHRSRKFLVSLLPYPFGRM